jgi:hypothetical protein
MDQEVEQKTQHNLPQTITVGWIIVIVVCSLLNPNHTVSHTHSLNQPLSLGDLPPS